MIKYQTLPLFNTTNLRLIELSYNQIDDLFRMRNDIRMHNHTDTKPDVTIIETRNYIDKMLQGVKDNKWMIWAIEHKETNKIIGTISIWNFQHKRAELGFGIIPEYQGLGLMKEALFTVIGYGFENLELSELDAFTEENNIKCLILLHKCDFNYISEIIDKGYLNNRDYTMLCYRIQRDKHV